MAENASAAGNTPGIANVLNETRLFPPPKAVAATAHVSSMEQYREMHARSLADPANFWGPIARENFHWFTPFETVVDWKLPDAKWFLGGKTNLSYNCLDRQIEQGLGEKTALLFEGEPVDDAGQPKDVQAITFSELRDRVAVFAGALKELGVGKGDVVTLYMPMTPELPIAMLACARIGAIHSVIFGGFSANAIVERVRDADSRIILTGDGAWRRGKVVPLKQTVDEACEQLPEVKTVVVLKRTESDIGWHEGRDVWWHDAIADAAPADAEPLDSEDVSFILYTSGSTGKPKGVFHTTAGYMVWTATTAKYTFDLQQDDVYWCTADCGWITGHSYLVYGILANGCTSVVYEGAPNFPDWSRFWSMVERHHVTKFYTAPTAIRAFMRQGEEPVTKHDLGSLKILGTVGEPINPEAWMWYHRVVGGERCPIVDTWWQTETGGHMLTPLPGATTTKPGSATYPMFGVDAAIMDKSGNELPANEGGYLVIKKPWPGMLRGVWGDRDRFIAQYWSEIEGVYFAGDAARRDEDGCFWIQGRVDDVMNISGHRIGTAEVESAIVSHPKVAECAVIPVPDEITGEAIVAFVTVNADVEPSDELNRDIVRHVEKEIGKIARPKEIRFAEGLPKTRSGKIMRRLLKEMAATGTVSGDVTTLEDFNVLAKLKDE